MFYAGINANAETLCNLLNLSCAKSNTVNSWEWRKINLKKKKRHENSAMNCQMGESNLENRTSNVFITFEKRQRMKRIDMKFSLKNTNNNNMWTSMKRYTNCRRDEKKKCVEIGKVGVRETGRPRSHCKISLSAITKQRNNSNNIISISSIY